MASDVLQVVWSAALALSLGLVFVLLVRVPLRRFADPRALRWPWSAALLAPLASLLPGPAAPTIVTPAVSLQVLATGAAAGNGAAVQAASWWPQAAALLLVLWLAGCGVSAMTCMRQQGRFVRSLGRLAPRGDGTFSASSSSGTPAVLGVVAPRIVLPADFERRFTPVERELVLAHERAHRAAYDTTIAAVAAIMRCIFWFHPLVHVAARCLRLDQEYACDAAVLVAHPRRRRSYAEAMLKAQHGPLLPLGCKWHAGSPLLARVRQLRAAPPSPRRLALGRVAAALVVLLAATATWAMQPAVPQGATGRWVEARIELRAGADFGVAIPDAPEAARLLVQDGQPFSLRMDTPGAIWEVAGVPRFVSDGRMWLDVQLLRGGELVMSSSDEHAPGQPLSLRSGRMEDGVRATASITLWPAPDAGALPEREAEQRATGRVRVGFVGAQADTGFFDGPVGREFEAAMPPDAGVAVHYRVTRLTAQQASVSMRIVQPRVDGSLHLLSTPALVLERGKDAMVRMDVPHDAGNDTNTGRAGDPAHARTIEIALTVDPA